MNIWIDASTGHGFQGDEHVFKEVFQGHGMEKESFRNMSVKVRLNGFPGRNSSPKNQNVYHPRLFLHQNGFEEI